jgi:hypothetical protein
MSSSSTDRYGKNDSVDWGASIILASCNTDPAQQLEVEFVVHNPVLNVESLSQCLRVPGSVAPAGCGVLVVLPHSLLQFLLLFFGLFLGLFFVLLLGLFRGLFLDRFRCLSICCFFDPFLLFSFVFGSWWAKSSGKSGSSFSFAFARSASIGVFVARGDGVSDTRVGEALPE